MTTKEYLEQIGKLDSEINGKLSVLTSLEASATKVTGSLDGEVVSHSRNMHSMQDVIAKIMDLREEINADTDRLVDLRREMQKMIQKLNDADCQVVLTLRYVWLKPWSEIASVLHCHIRNTYKIRDRALECIAPLLRDKGVEIGHYGPLDGNG